MSIELMNMVWNRTEPKAPLQRLVLVLLADMANDHGVCWPSVGYIAKRAGLSSRTVQRMLRSLTETGWLEVGVREGPADRPDQRPSTYRVLKERGDRACNGVTERADGVTERAHGVTERAERGDTVVTQTTIEPPENPKGTGRTVPARPDLTEWLVYCGEIGYSDTVDAERAFNRYESVGWKHGRGLVVKDWRAAARTCRGTWQAFRGGSRTDSGGRWPVKKLSVDAAAQAAREAEAFDPTLPYAHTGGVPDAFQVLEAEEQAAKLESAGGGA